MGSILFPSEGYESQSVILKILSHCPTDTYIEHLSFCLVFLMEPWFFYLVSYLHTKVSLLSEGFKYNLAYLFLPRVFLAPLGGFFLPKKSGGMGDGVTLKLEKFHTPELKRVSLNQIG